MRRQRDHAADFQTHGRAKLVYVSFFAHGEDRDPVSAALTQDVPIKGVVVHGLFLHVQADHAHASAVGTEGLLKLSKAGGAREGRGAASEMRKTIRRPRGRNASGVIFYI